MRHFYPALSRNRYSQFGQELAAAQRSLYYWWWRYLRLSEDYWWLCRQKGRSLDKEFNKTYKMFGDVHSINFKEWWLSNGTKIFSYKVDPPRAQFVNIQDLFFAKDESTKLWLRPLMIPNHLTKSEVLEQVIELLEDHKRKDLPKSIVTEYGVEDLRGIRKKALIDSHRVWCLHSAIEIAKKQNLLSRPERFTQYWIGKKLELDPKAVSGKRVRATVEANHRLAMRVKVNRYLSKVSNIIANVELGRFPVLTDVPERKRWSVKQLSEKNKAIEAGMWVCPESSSDEFKKMIFE
jgi:hypothetical protein